VNLHEPLIGLAVAAVAVYWLRSVFTPRRKPAEQRGPTRCDCGETGLDNDEDVIFEVYEGEPRTAHARRLCCPAAEVVL
jgi:hypothetical protein